MDESDTSSARGSTPPRPTIPPPGDEQVVYRSDPGREVHGASQRRGFDVLATLAGALAALGTLLLLSSLAGTLGTIGFQRGLDDEDVSIGGLVAGLVILFLACLVGGWVAGRIARRRGGLHGLVVPVWLLVLAALLALLAAVAGDEADVRAQVGLPDWFSSDAATAVAIGTGLLALALMLLGGWLGGRLGERHGRGDTDVEVIETRRGVREHPGGIGSTDVSDTSRTEEGR